jgi:hypothetical protein
LVYFYFYYIVQKWSPEMGIRAIDVQVAIQRASDADKIQQGDIANARAGEAAVREDVKETRTRQQQQPGKTEKSDQLIIQHEKEKERKDEEEKEGEEIQLMQEEESQGGKSIRKPLVQGGLDIMA